MSDDKMMLTYSGKSNPPEYMQFDYSGYIYTLGRCRNVIISLDINDDRKAFINIRTGFKPKQFHISAIIKYKDINNIIPRVKLNRDTQATVFDTRAVWSEFSDSSK